MHIDCKVFEGAEFKYGINFELGLKITRVRNLNFIGITDTYNFRAGKFFKTLNLYSNLASFLS